MSDDALYVLGVAVTIVLLRARAPWTRPGGLVLAAVLGIVSIVALARVDGALARPGMVASLLFLGPSLWLCWRALHRRLRVENRERVHSMRPRRQTDDDAPGTMLEGSLDTRLDTKSEAKLETTARDSAGSRDFPHPALAPTAATLSAVLLAAAWPAGRSEGLPWPVRGLDWLAARVGPGLAELALPSLVVVGLLAAPLFDTRAADAPSDSGLRRDEVPFFVLAFVLLGALPLALSIAGGATSPPEVAPLAERVWNDLLGAPSPNHWAAREAPGILLLLGLFVGLPLWLPRWRATRGAFERHRKRLGPARYALLLALVVALLYVPLRVVLGWALGVGPLVELPMTGIAL